MIPRVPAKMKAREFQKFSSFIYDLVGIQLPPTKMTMLESRLDKRLRSLGISSYEEYGDFVFSEEGKQAELIHLIDAVTTNKTDFFREPGHFQFLTDTTLPTLMKKRDITRDNPVRIWSAGCSSGEEPYTLAMVLEEFASANADFHYSILASDISTRILETARKAIYAEDRIADIALPLKKKYLLRSKDRANPRVRICPKLRAKISFRRINFMHTDFGIAEKMDIVFCRNVIIYFDKTTQQALMRKFHQQLRPGGYLFLGHSETLNGIDIDFKSVGSTVYLKT
jgi:chemotaxis protein methyltransferase CheR